MATKTNKDFSFKSLTDRLNGYWYSIVGLPQPKEAPIYTWDNLIELKHMLADVNGLISVKTEKAFVRRLTELNIISKDEETKALASIDNGTPYDNGYDVVIDNPAIAAEIKCNIPVGEASFGAAQMSALRKDLKKLYFPELKITKQLSLPEDFYKFIVLLRLGDNFGPSIEKLIHTSVNRDRVSVKMYEPGEIMNTNTVYLMIIDINQLDMD